MKNTKTFLIAVAAILSGVITSYAQHNTTAKDSTSYPNINTPNHTADEPVIHGTFDDPKIIPDSSERKKDNRSRENLDSLSTRQRKKPGNEPMKKDTLKE